ncbi:MAG: methionine--tRNA ligase [Candidatus Aenigmarchaeota archaeon]|nr:methionine--tRNA ligase [Candidatus Aenigmarchaeota archaeon]
MSKFYITTAIDYVNSAPHCGHAYEKVCADIIARWHRLLGDDVFFLTGTDENAQKNVQAAKKAGVPIKAFVDRNVEQFKHLCKVLNISNDDFIRTTEPRHIRVSQMMFKKCMDNGDIYKGEYSGYYCPGCEAYKTEKELADGKCPEHDKVEWMSESAYFFRLSKYTDRIRKLAETGFIQPAAWRNEILARLKDEPLKDLCVSRSNLNWGIDVPGDPKHKIYVWFDALINYVSGVDYPDGAKFKRYWPADVHLIGKGINFFHSVIWPAMLLSADIELPKHVVVHGYVNMAGAKMSKSKGTAVDPIEIVEKYGPDQLRYFLMRDVPFGGDGDYSEEALTARINGELVSDVGNLAYRVLTLAERFEGRTAGKPELEKRLNLAKIRKHMEAYELHLALEEVLVFVRACNKYINDNKVWALKGAEMGNALYNLLEALRIIAILLEPFMPSTAEKLNAQLGVKPGLLKDAKFGAWKGRPKKGAMLFRKIESK